MTPQTALTTKTTLTLSAPIPLDRNPAAVYLAHLAKGSRPTMRGALGKITDIILPDLFVEPGHSASKAEWARYHNRGLAVNWAALRFQHTAAIRSMLAEAYAPVTANRILSALRGVLKAAWRLDLMLADHYTRAADIDPVTGSTLPAGRALTSGEIAALMEACASDSTPAGARDAAMLALLRVGGLRRAEVCALDLADYNPADGMLVIRGKRNKERTAYVANGAALALTDWLAVRGDDPGPLFCPVNKGGKMIARRMFPEAVFNMLKKRGEQAGVKYFSPHDLRRTFAGDLLDAGADISTVQKLMGHASVTTTQRYDRRGEEAKRKAVELLHVPYVRRKSKPEGKKKSRK
jgi:site-specific recombinase XerD